MTTTISGDTGVSQVQAGVVTPSDLTQPLTLATAQTTTSGVSKTFSGIPSWVRRIKVIFAGVSLTGTSSISIILGTAGGLEGTGYSGTSGSIYNTGAGITSATSAFFLNTNAAAIVIDGTVELINITGNTWVCSGTVGSTIAGAANLIMIHATGSKILAGTLTQIQVAASNGTDNFDAGTINIMYEG